MWSESIFEVKPVGVDGGEVVWQCELVPNRETKV